MTRRRVENSTSAKPRNLSAKDPSAKHVSANVAASERLELARRPAASSRAKTPAQVTPRAGSQTGRRSSTKAKPRTSPSHVRVTARGHESQMVDVGSKPVSARSASARARITFPGDVLEIALAGNAPKGPVTEVARVAGILAAKRTGDLIPMCHPLALDHVEIVFERIATNRLEIRCRASCTGRTGIEMEALVGASVAALTVYDMTKALDHGIVIEAIELLEKTGGKSGVWRKREGVLEARGPR